MNYLSTRGGISKSTAAEAIRQGLAPDGGLFTPESIPHITPNELQTMLTMTYSELAVRIISLFLTDFQPADLQKMVAAAYAYPDKFVDPKVTPIKKLTDNQYVLELWHGPTCAFKDIALQLLPHLMTKASLMVNDSRETVILVATSGDTGKAALEGFRDVPGTKIIVFFPEEGVSQVQRLQMLTQEGHNTYVAAVKGNFDDTQNGVKQIFTDPAIIQKLNQHGMSFSSANSINWGRLVPQIVYYFFGYLEMCRQGGLKLGNVLNITVPTGNFGNILAAFFAQQMGLPLGKMICASNSNNVLTDFINTGVYDRNRSFYTTASPSMDILISSNLERLLYYLSGNNVASVKQWMEQLNKTGKYQVDSGTFLQIKKLFYGGFADESETLTTIKQVFDATGYTLDTHTAVGQAVYQRYQQQTGDSTPMLLAATASPFKFNSSVMRAIAGETAVTGKNEFELLEELQTVSKLPIPQSLNGLDRKQIQHQTVCQKQEMAEIVEKMLGI